MGIVVSRNRQTAIVSGAKGNAAHGLISDVTIHVGIYDVLSGADPLGECLTELLPILRGVQIKERKLKRAGRIKGPFERQRAFFGRKKFADDGA